MSVHLSHPHRVGDGDDTGDETGDGVGLGTGGAGDGSLGTSRIMLP